MKNAWKRRLTAAWRDGAKELVIVLAVMIPFRSSIADWNHVPTGSMKPTVLEGDRIFVNKLAYDLKVPLTTWSLARWADPARGDIVVFRSPESGQRLVKRVIGLPGDVVEMRGERLWLNGRALDYAPAPAASPATVAATERLGGISHAVQFLPGQPALRSFGPVTVLPGRYLVLGDNRDNSHDSRYFGFVDRDLIAGRVPAVVMSFDRDRFYLPRSDRWFRTL